MTETDLKLKNMQEAKSTL